MRRGASPSYDRRRGGFGCRETDYPPKERDSKTEAVVVFFCEVAANGRAKNVRTYWNKGYNRFGDAVEKALNQGHFVPAMVEGKPLPVLIGATVFFFARGDRPTVVIAM